MTTFIQVNLGLIQLTHTDEAGWVLSRPGHDEKIRLSEDERDGLVRLLSEIGWKTFPGYFNGTSNRKNGQLFLMLQEEDQEGLTTVQRIGLPWFEAAKDEQEKCSGLRMLVPMYGFRCSVESEELCPTFPSTWWQLKAVELIPQEGGFAKEAVYDYCGPVAPPSDLLSWSIASPYLTDEENLASYKDFSKRMAEVYAKHKKEMEEFNRFQHAPDDSIIYR